MAIAGQMPALAPIVVALDLPCGMVALIAFVPCTMGGIQHGQGRDLLGSVAAGEAHKSAHHLYIWDTGTAQVVKLLEGPKTGLVDLAVCSRLLYLARVGSQSDGVGCIAFRFLGLALFTRA